MPCYHPVDCWYSKHKFPSGKQQILYGYYDARKTLNNSPCTPDFQAPCRQCVGCRLERSRQWAMRCLHEAQMHETNSFITLTFSPEELLKRPNVWSLDHTEWQKFMKKLKSKLRRDYGPAAANAVRFYMCGEYGEQFARPHYHACVFNHDFVDKTLWTERDGIPLYKSASLDSLWTTSYGEPLGFTSVGDVTFQSAAYVARYVMKKWKGTPEEIEAHYQTLDPITGETYSIQPEFALMSKGLGKTWFKKHQSDTDKDYITVNRQKMSLPKYYTSLIEQQGEDIKHRKSKRLKALNKSDNTRERLLTKEIIKKSRTKLLLRNLQEQS